jgi:POT family proton-dependent oligopeptide transporter
MGIILGAFFAPLVCGWLAQSEQFRRVLAGTGIAPESAWHWGFGMAAIGMFFGLLQYLAGWKHLGDAGGIALLVVTGGFFARLFTSGDWTAAERKRLVTIAVLFVASVIFWAVYEQAGSTLNLFAERTTDNRIFGRPFPAAWYQSLPPIYVILLAPVFAWLWVRLGQREPSSPAKFVLGLVFVGLGFVILVPAAGLAASGIRVSPAWLVATYLLHVIGELCLSPVGLSATTKLAPARVVGLMMGVWFMSLAMGNYIGGLAAAQYEAVSLPVLFGRIGGFAIAAGIVLALLVKPIGRMLARAD